MFKIKYLFIILYIILILVFLLKTIQIMGIDFYENITLKSFQNKIFELTENVGEVEAHRMNSSCMPSGSAQPIK